MKRELAAARAAEKNRAGLADPGQEFYSAEVEPGVWSVLSRPIAGADLDEEIATAAQPQAPDPYGPPGPPRWRPLRRTLATVVAGALGLAIGFGVGAGAGDDSTATVTQAAKAAKTVTETETDTETATETETETVTAPGPGGGGRGGGDVSDDEDGDDCSDNYDAGACVPPYTRTTT